MTPEMEDLVFKRTSRLDRKQHIPQRLSFIRLHDQLNHLPSVNLDTE
jgi:hypothetical protein